jgi:hypothetical protein
MKITGRQMKQILIYAIIFSLFGILEILLNIKLPSLRGSAYTIIVFLTGYLLCYYTYKKER